MTEKLAELFDLPPASKEVAEALDSANQLEASVQIGRAHV